MKKNRQVVLVCVAILAIIVCFFVAKMCANAHISGEKRLKIGFVIALTGEDASAGKPIANTIEILREKYRNVDFFIEDSKSTASAGVNAANKLLSIEDVDLLYCDLSNVASALVPLTEKHNKLFMATVFLQDFISQGRYTIRNFMTIESQARAALPRVKDILPLAQTAAIAVSNDEVGRASIVGFNNALKETSYKNINTYHFDADSIKAVAAAAAKSRADFMYVSSFTATLGRFIKELHYNGYKGQIVTSTALTFPFIRDAAGDAVHGVLHMDFPKTEKYEEVRNDYIKRFGENPPLTVFLCFDGVSMFVDAYMQTANGTNDEVLEKLEGMQYDGSYGVLNVKGREIIYPLITVLEPK